MKPLSPKVWIYLEAEKKWRQLARTSPKLDWTGSVPQGYVRYTPRKNSPNFTYVAFGDTPESCCEAINQHTLKRIAVIEAKLDVERARLVRIPSRIATKNPTHPYWRPDTQ